MIVVQIAKDMISFNAWYSSILYLIFSFLFVSIIYKKTLNSFLSRKILHILMSNWWCIRLLFIDIKNLWIGPFVFIVLNFFWTFHKKEKDYGLVCFAVSLTLLTYAVEYLPICISAATAAIYVLGFSDSLAALIGRAYQKKYCLEYKKSVLGTITFAFTTTIVISFVNILMLNKEIHILIIIIFSVFLAYVEAKILPSLDNITIPLCTFVFILYNFF